MDRPDIPSDSQPNFVVFRTKKFYQLDLALGAVSGRPTRFTGRLSTSGMSRFYPAKREKAI